MAKEAEIGGGQRGNRWRIAGWGLAGLLLLLPLVANAPWTASDFVFAAVVIGAVGGLFELTVRMSRNYFYRAGIGFALAAAFLTVWVNGAVGMIGNEDNPYNLVFLGVIVLALAGGILTRFRAAGMAVAMSIAAAAQLAAALFGAFSDLRGGILSAMFAGIWLISAALFSRAARDRDEAGGGVKA